MTVFDVFVGDGPVILSQPHGGTFVPDAIAARLNDNGRLLADTDWHITRLYDGLLPGATVVKSNVHRYVIDANRDPAGMSLYPGQNTTTLVPLTDFDGTAIWQEGEQPSDGDIADRLAAYHTPYHAALTSEIERVKSIHGVVILFDCHSIRSHIPFLFEGQLPIFNTGTNNGTTCSASLERTVDGIAAASGRSSVLNGRFKGGWTTRHYGRPETGVHAVQMEISQRAYMHETPPWAWDADRAARIRPHLKVMLEQLTDLALSGRLQPTGSDQ